MTHHHEHEIPLKKRKRTFNIVLGNCLVAAVTNAFVWFAIVFWAYLNTNSVIATGFIGGIFAVLNTISAFVFGSIVDHNTKKNVMIYSSIGSLICYIIAAVIYFLSPQEAFTHVDSWLLWAFAIMVMVGSIIGSLRYIALSTTVPMLFPLEEHAKANGKIGTMNGVSFALTSVAS